MFVNMDTDFSIFYDTEVELTIPEDFTAQQDLLLLMIIVHLKISFKNKLNMKIIDNFTLQRYNSRKILYAELTKQKDCEFHWIWAHFGLFLIQSGTNMICGSAQYIQDNISKQTVKSIIQYQSNIQFNCICTNETFDFQQDCDANEVIDLSKKLFYQQSVMIYLERFSAQHATSSLMLTSILSLFTVDMNFKPENFLKQNLYHTYNNICCEFYQTGQAQESYFVTQNQYLYNNFTQSPFHFMLRNDVVPSKLYMSHLKTVIEHSNMFKLCHILCNFVFQREYSQKIKNNSYVLASGSKTGKSTFNLANYFFHFFNGILKSTPVFAVNIQENYTIENQPLYQLADVNINNFITDFHNNLLKCKFDDINEVVIASVEDQLQYPQKLKSLIKILVEALNQNFHRQKLFHNQFNQLQTWTCKSLVQSIKQIDNLESSLQMYIFVVKYIQNITCFTNDINGFNSYLNSILQYQLAPKQNNDYTLPVDINGLKNCLLYKFESNQHIEDLRKLTHNQISESDLMSEACTWKPMMIMDEVCLRNSSAQLSIEQITKLNDLILHNNNIDAQIIITRILNQSMKYLLEQLNQEELVLLTNPCLIFCRPPELQELLLSKQLYKYEFYFKNLRNMQSLTTFEAVMYKDLFGIFESVLYNHSNEQKILDTFDEDMIATILTNVFSKNHQNTLSKTQLSTFEDSICIQKTTYSTSGTEASLYNDINWIKCLKSQITSRDNPTTDTVSCCPLVTPQLHPYMLNQNYYILGRDSCNASLKTGPRTDQSSVIINLLSCIQGNALQNIQNQQSTISPYLVIVDLLNRVRYSKSQQIWRCLTNGIDCHKYIMNKIDVQAIKYQMQISKQKIDDNSNANDKGTQLNDKFVQVNVDNNVVIKILQKSSCEQIQIQPLATSNIFYLAAHVHQKIEDFLHAITLEQGSESESESRQLNFQQKYNNIVAQSGFQCIVQQFYYLLNRKDCILGSRSQIFESLHAVEILLALVPNNIEQLSKIKYFFESIKYCQQKDVQINNQQYGSLNEFFIQSSFNTKIQTYLTILQPEFLAHDQNNTQLQHFQLFVVRQIELARIAANNIFAEYQDTKVVIIATICDKQNMFKTVFQHQSINFSCPDFIITVHGKQLDLIYVQNIFYKYENTQNCTDINFDTLVFMFENGPHTGTELDNKAEFYPIFGAQFKQELQNIYFTFQPANPNYKNSRNIQSKISIFEKPELFLDKFSNKKMFDITKNIRFQLNGNIFCKPEVSEIQEYKFRLQLNKMPVQDTNYSYQYTSELLLKEHEPQDQYSTQTIRIIEELKGCDSCTEQTAILALPRYRTTAPCNYQFIFGQMMLNISNNLSKQIEAPIYYQVCGNIYLSIPCIIYQQTKSQFNIDLMLLNKQEYVTVKEFRQVVTFNSRDKSYNPKVFFDLSRLKCCTYMTDTTKLQYIFQNLKENTQYQVELENIANKDIIQIDISSSNNSIAVNFGVVPIYINIESESYSIDFDEIRNVCKVGTKMKQLIFESQQDNICQIVLNTNKIIETQTIQTKLLLNSNEHIHYIIVNKYYFNVQYEIEQLRQIQFIQNQQIEMCIYRIEKTCKIKINNEIIINYDNDETQQLHFYNINYNTKIYEIPDFKLMDIEPVFATQQDIQYQIQFCEGKYNILKEQKYRKIQIQYLTKTNCVLNFDEGTRSVKLNGNVQHIWILENQIPLFAIIKAEKHQIILVNNIYQVQNQIIKVVQYRIESIIEKTNMLLTFYYDNGLNSLERCSNNNDECVMLDKMEPVYAKCMNSGVKYSITKIQTINMLYYNLKQTKSEYQAVTISSDVNCKIHFQICSRIEQLKENEEKNILISQNDLPYYAEYQSQLVGFKFENNKYIIDCNRKVIQIKVNKTQDELFQLLNNNIEQINGQIIQQQSDFIIIAVKINEMQEIELLGKKFTCKDNQIQYQVVSLELNKIEIEFIKMRIPGFKKLTQISIILYQSNNNQLKQNYKLSDLQHQNAIIQLPLMDVYKIQFDTLVANVSYDNSALKLNMFEFNLSAQLQNQFTQDNQCIEAKLCYVGERIFPVFSGQQYYINENNNNLEAQCITVYIPQIYLKQLNVQSKQNIYLSMLNQENIELTHEYQKTDNSINQVFVKYPGTASNPIIKMCFSNAMAKVIIHHSSDFFVATFQKNQCQWLTNEFRDQIPFLRQNDNEIKVILPYDQFVLAGMNIKYELSQTGLYVFYENVLLKIPNSLQVLNQYKDQSSTKFKIVFNDQTTLTLNQLQSTTLKITPTQTISHLILNFGSFSVAECNREFTVDKQIFKYLNGPKKFTAVYKNKGAVKITGEADVQEIDEKLLRIKSQNIYKFKFKMENGLFYVEKEINWVIILILIVVVGIIAVIFAK
ncbi:Hypothetical_protein [Hexamita inflata]|uniref:Hypothetical_protein n=1 Tax=Hexamita inflata TaxID=28002 RepID=A0AA86UCS7_9EUKA|nr:Hypothetical protein HINF_LOCUS40530 [Hexamita inflata]